MGWSLFCNATIGVLSGFAVISHGKSELVGASLYLGSRDVFSLIIGNTHLNYHCKIAYRKQGIWIENTK